LEMESVNPSSGIVLRQVRKEDYEIEFPFFSLMPEELAFPEPQGFTILEIEEETTSIEIIREEIELISKILRLFRIGGVKPVRIAIHSEALASGTYKTFPTSILPLTIPSYTIRQKDKDKLKNFWREIEKPLLNLPNPTQTPKPGLEHLFFANTFYEDALLREGRFEEKVARAVMGLEALLLKPIEKQELSYRLRLRTAKLLGLFGFNAIDVKKSIQRAYDIRSNYAHGGLLSNEDIKDIRSEYNRLEDFLYSILNYLRLLLITMLICEASEIQKDGLITLLDNSFIDPNQDKELKEKLSKAIEIVQEVKE